VGGHVVVAFRRVDVKRIAIRDEAFEKGLQVATDIRVGIFLNEQGGGGVAEMKSEKALLEAVFGKPVLNQVGEFIKTAAFGEDSQIVGSLAEHGAEGSRCLLGNKEREKK
jgi:hypothetical protein